MDRLGKVFKLSFLLYIITILLAIYNGILGVQLGFFSDSHIIYGLNAIILYIMGVVVNFKIVYIIVFVFQIIYITARLIKILRKENG